MLYKKKIVLIYISLCLFSFGCDDKQNSTSNKELKIIENSDNILFNGVTYGIIEYNGKKWFDRNLGAKESCSDYKGNKSCWGDLYQWGRISDGHQYRDSGVSLKKLETCMDNSDKFIVVESSGAILKEVNKIATSKWYKRCDDKIWYKKALRNLCPTSWHVSSKKDIESLELKNIQDGYRKIKLSLTGFRMGIERYSAGGKIGNYESGYYWLSSYNKNNKGNISVGYLDIGERDIYIFFKEQLINGYAIRCVKDD